MRASSEQISKAPATIQSSRSTYKSTNQPQAKPQSANASNHCTGSTARIQELEIDHSQRLQTADPLPRRNRARDERERCGAGGAEARDVADGARDELVGEDVPRVVDHDGEDGPEEDADEGDAHCGGDERVDEPDDELEAAGRAGVSCRTKGGGRGQKGGGEKGRILTRGRGRCR